MDKDYLIQFNADGTRLNTYANTAHYQVVGEEIINLVGDFNYQNVLDNGGVWLSKDDYNKLIGNADKEYIYKDGKIIEKPRYVPTAEELQEQERQALDAEYAVKFANKDNEIIQASVVLRDEEYVEQLRQERTALVQEYEDKRNAL